MQRTHQDQLTVEHKQALAAVIDGADVYDYLTAIRLREVEKVAPHLINICAAKNPPPGHERQPYFGAITTAAGKVFVGCKGR